MSKLPAGPGKGDSSSSGSGSSDPILDAPKPSRTVVRSSAPAPASGGLPFGLKRNHLIGIGAVLAIVVALVVIRPWGGDEEGDAAGLGKKGKGKGKRADAKAARSSRGLCQLVDCTEEQKTSIKPLLQTYQEAIAADEKGLREAYAAVAAAFSEETFDDAALEEAYGVVGGHQEAIDRQARQTLAAVHELLTPEQRETVAKQVAREGPASIFEKGGKGAIERPRRAEKRRAKRGLEGDPARTEAARALQGVDGTLKPSRKVDRGDDEAEEEAPPEDEAERPVPMSGAPI